MNTCLLCDFVAVQPPLPLPLKERSVVDGAGDGRLRDDKVAW